MPQSWHVNVWFQCHQEFNVFSQAIPLIEKESIENHLWIIEETRVRILGNEET
jgi:hypothetical protein